MRHIISSTPLQVCSSIATRYSNLNTSPSPQVVQAGSGTTQPNKQIKSDAASPSQANDTKRGDASNQRSSSPTKKGRGKAEVLKDRTKFGIFYLEDADTRSPVFPPNMDQKLCAFYILARANSVTPIIVLSSTQRKGRSQLRLGSRSVNISRGLKLDGSMNILWLMKNAKTSQKSTTTCLGEALVPKTLVRAPD